MSKKINHTDLKNGHLYEIEARNQNRGIWVAEKGGFEIARTKFDRTFLFIEYEWDLGLNGNTKLGTARAFRELGPVPQDILHNDVKRLEYLKSFTEPTNYEMSRYTKDEKFKKYVDLLGWPDYTR